jgi:hypothetical protein
MHELFVNLAEAVLRSLCTGRKVLAALWHHRITDILPGCETSQDGRHICKTVLQHDLRRTGAGFFARSGAVSNDPLIRVKFAQARFHILQRD